MQEQTLRIHHLLPASRVNGPGLRAVIWVQGCTLGCPGCFNPETHTGAAGSTMPVDDVVQWIEAQPGVEGITLSGGEPLQQMRPLLALLERVRQKTALSVVLFSGYTWQEINAMPAKDRLASLVDVLIAGRYIADQRLAHGLKGSSNKTMHFLSPRYTAQDMQQVQEAEVIIGPDGEIILSGIDPLKWQP